MFLLVLYHSSGGHTQTLAEAVADGCERAGVEARLRVPPPINDREPDALVVTKEELRACAGLALGSPVRFGQMAASLKVFFETTSDIWLSGELIDRPAGVFTSGSTLHGGQEATLLGMTLPLIHHGMLVTGLPFTEPGLAAKSGGGTPYGPSRVENDALAPHEQALARRLGERLATLIKALT